MDLISWTATVKEYPEYSGVFNVVQIAAESANGNETIFAYPEYLPQYTHGRDLTEDLMAYARDQCGLKVATWNIGTACNKAKANNLVKFNAFKPVFDKDVSILFLQEIDAMASTIIHEHFVSVCEDWNVRHSDDCCVLFRAFESTVDDSKGDRLCEALLMSAFGEILVGSYHAPRAVDKRAEFLDSLNVIASNHTNALFGGDANGPADLVGNQMPDVPLVVDVGVKTSDTTRARGAIDHVSSDLFVLQEGRNTSGVIKNSDISGLVELLNESGLSFLHQVHAYNRKVPDHHFVWMSITPNATAEHLIHIEIEDDEGCGIEDTHFAGFEFGEDEENGVSKDY